MADVVLSANVDSFLTSANKAEMRAAMDLTDAAIAGYLIAADLATLLPTTDPGSGKMWLDSSGALAVGAYTGIELTSGSIATALGYTPANDSLVAHLAGAETLTGAKTFSEKITLTASAFSAYGDYLVAKNSSGFDEVSIEQGQFAGYGGTVSVHDGTGGGGYARLVYSLGYPKFETSRTSFTFSGSGFTNRFTNTYIDFAIGSQYPLYMSSSYLGVFEQSPSARLHVTGSSAATKLLLLKGASLQSGNFIEAVDSTGLTTYFSVSSAGGATFSSTLNGTLIVASNNISNGYSIKNSSGTAISTLMMSSANDTYLQTTINSAELIIRTSGTGGSIKIQPNLTTVIQATSTGVTITGTASFSGSGTFTPASDAGVGLTVKGYSTTQSGNLQEWQTSASSARASMGVDGRFNAYGFRLHSGSGIGVSYIDACYTDLHMKFHSGLVLKWSSTGSSISGTYDIGLARNAAGVLEVNTGTAGTLADLTAANATFTGNITMTADMRVGTSANYFLPRTSSFRLYAGSAMVVESTSSDLTIKPSQNFQVTTANLVRQAIDINGNTTFSPVWNNVATTFTGVLINATDIVSASTSLLQDWQVGGTSRASIDKNGKFVVGSGTYRLTAGGASANYLFLGTSAVPNCLALVVDTGAKVSYLSQHLSGGASALFGGNQSNTGHGSVWAYSSANTTYPGAVALRTNETMQLMVNVSGRVMIGSTTDDGVNKLQVTGSITTTSNLNVDGVTTLGDYALASVPTASSYTGGSIRISDYGYRLAYSDGTDWRWEETGAKIAEAPTSSISIRIDGAGSAITTGAKKVYFRVPYACTITGYELVADQAGSAVLDIWKDTYANFPPTVADTITAAAKPTLSAAISTQSTTLTGWTTSLAQGDYLEINVDSASTVTLLILTLNVRRT